MKDYGRWLASALSGQHKQRLLLASLIPEWLAKGRPKLQWVAYLLIVSSCFFLLMTKQWPSFFEYPVWSVLLLLSLSIIFLFGVYMTDRFGYQRWPFYLRYAEYAKAKDVDEIDELVILDKGGDFTAVPRNMVFRFVGVLAPAVLLALVFVLALFFPVMSSLPWVVLWFLLLLVVVWLLLHFRELTGISTLKAYYLYRELGEDSEQVRLVREMRQKYPDDYAYSCRGAGA